MSEFEIVLDTPFAKELGFTSDKFDGYLWRKDNYIIISFIISLKEGQGNLSNLFKTIQSKGYGIKIPTPFARMKAICIIKGFKEMTEPFAPEHGMYDPCEVWVKDPCVSDEGDSP